MNEYLKDGLESLKDISEGAVPPEVYYLSAKAVLEHINNLQSKIDKAIEYIKLMEKYDGEHCTRNFKMMSADFNHLLDILEEDK